MPYSAITDRMLSVIKPPPIQAPYNLSYNSVSTSQINNVLLNIFSFRARFVYDDNEKSAWGPTSDVIDYHLMFYPLGLRTVSSY